MRSNARRNLRSGAPCEGEDWGVRGARRGQLPLVEQLETSVGNEYTSASLGKDVDGPAGGGKVDLVASSRGCLQPPTSILNPRVTTLGGRVIKYSVRDGTDNKLRICSAFAAGQLKGPRGDTKGATRSWLISILA